MNFFKRALTSVVRRPGKSVILLVLIFVLSNVIAGAVSVKNALANTEEAMLGSMGVTVKIEIDYNNLDYRDPYFKYPTVTSGMADKIGASEYVKDYDYTIRFGLQADGVRNYYSNPDWVSDGDGYFQLYGGSSPNIADMLTGDMKIVEGRTYTQAEIDSGAQVMVISDQVAQLNGLTVGSKIKVYQIIYPNYDVVMPMPRDDFAYDIAVSSDKAGSEYNTVEFEYEVIGIFNGKLVRTTDWMGNVTEESPLNNTFYTGNKSVVALTEAVSEAERQEGRSGDVYTESAAIFMLKHPDDVELFVSQNKQYLDDGHMFTDNASEFDIIREPMSNVEWIADIVMWVAVVATVLIISLLVTLFLRDRRHEMGIYLALGERKVIIASQILSEVLLIALVAVSLSVFSGNYLANKMSTTMLENQLAEQEKSRAENDNNNSGGGIIWYKDIIGAPETESNHLISSEDVMDAYDVSIDGRTVLFIYVVGMGSVLISTLVPIVYTLQLKPRKILM